MDSNLEMGDRHRRRLSQEYKFRIILEAEACKRRGEVTALLRREGLYSSHLAAWRHKFRQAGRCALSSQPRGPKKRPDIELMLYTMRLEKENLKLRVAVEEARTTIETFRVSLRKRSSRREPLGPAPELAHEWV